MVVPFCEVQQTKSSFLKNQNFVKTSLACLTPGRKTIGYIRMNQRAIDIQQYWSRYSAIALQFYNFVSVESLWYFQERVSSIRMPKYFDFKLKTNIIILFIIKYAKFQLVSKSVLVLVKTYKVGFLNVQSQFVDCQPVIKVLQLNVI